jgi:hypothetical protein
MYASVQNANIEATILSLWPKRPDASSPSNFETFTTTIKVTIMLYTIAVVLLIMWLLGLVTSFTVGGFIHILLVVAVIMVLIRLISGRGI